MYGGMDGSGGGGTEPLFDVDPVAMMQDQFNINQQQHQQHQQLMLLQQRQQQQQQQFQQQQQASMQAHAGVGRSEQGGEDGAFFDASGTSTGMQPPSAFNPMTMAMMMKEAQMAATSGDMQQQQQQQQQRQQADEMQAQAQSQQQQQQQQQQPQQQMWSDSMTNSTNAAAFMQQQQHQSQQPFQAQQLHQQPFISSFQQAPQQFQQQFQQQLQQGNVADLSQLLAMQGGTMTEMQANGIGNQHPLAQLMLQQRLAQQHQQQQSFPFSPSNNNEIAAMLLAGQQRLNANAAARGAVFAGVPTPGSAFSLPLLASSIPSIPGTPTFSVRRASGSSATSAIVPSLSLPNMAVAAAAAAAATSNAMLSGHNIATAASQSLPSPILLGTPVGPDGLPLPMWRIPVEIRAPDRRKSTCEILAPLQITFGALLHLATNINHFVSVRIEHQLVPASLASRPLQDHSLIQSRAGQELQQRQSSIAQQQATGAASTEDLSAPLSLGLTISFELGSNVKSCTRLACPNLLLKKASRRACNQCHTQGYDLRAAQVRKLVLSAPRVTEEGLGWIQRTAKKQVADMMTMRGGENHSNQDVAGMEVAFATELTNALINAYSVGPLLAQLLDHALERIDHWKFDASDGAVTVTSRGLAASSATRTHINVVSPPSLSPPSSSTPPSLLLVFASIEGAQHFHAHFEKLVRAHALGGIDGVQRALEQSGMENTKAERRWRSGSTSGKRSHSTSSKRPSMMNGSTAASEVAGSSVVDADAVAHASATPAPSPLSPSHHPSLNAVTSGTSSTEVPSSSSCSRNSTSASGSASGSGSQDPTSVSKPMSSLSRPLSISRSPSISRSSTTLLRDGGESEADAEVEQEHSTNMHEHGADHLSNEDAKKPPMSIYEQLVREAIAATPDATLVAFDESAPSQLPQPHPLASYLELADVSKSYSIRMRSHFWKLEIKQTTDPTSRKAEVQSYRKIGKPNQRRTTGSSRANRSTSPSLRAETKEGSDADGDEDEEHEADDNDERKRRKSMSMSMSVEREDELVERHVDKSSMIVAGTTKAEPVDSKVVGHGAGGVSAMSSPSTTDASSRSSSGRAHKRRLEEMSAPSRPIIPVTDSIHEEKHAETTAVVATATKLHERKSPGEITTAAHHTIQSSYFTAASEPATSAAPLFRPVHSVRSPPRTSAVVDAEQSLTPTTPPSPPHHASSPTPSVSRSLISNSSAATGAGGSQVVVSSTDFERMRLQRQAMPATLSVTGEGDENEAMNAGNDAATETSSSHSSVIHSQPVLLIYRDSAQLHRDLAAGYLGDDLPPSEGGSGSGGGGGNNGGGRSPPRDHDRDRRHDHDDDENDNNGPSEQDPSKRRKIDGQTHMRLHGNHMQVRRWRVAGGSSSRAPFLSAHMLRASPFEDERKEDGRYGSISLRSSSSCMSGCRCDGCSDSSADDDKESSCRHDSCNSLCHAASSQSASRCSRHRHSVQDRDDASAIAAVGSSSSYALAPLPSSSGSNNDNNNHSQDSSESESSPVDRAVAAYRRAQSEADYALAVAWDAAESAEQRRHKTAEKLNSDRGASNAMDMRRRQGAGAGTSNSSAPDRALSDESPLLDLLSDPDEKATGKKLVHANVRRKLALLGLSPTMEWMRSNGSNGETEKADPGFLNQCGRRLTSLMTSRSGILVSLLILILFALFTVFLLAVNGPSRGGLRVADTLSTFGDLQIFTPQEDAATLKEQLTEERTRRRIEITIKSMRTASSVFDTWARVTEEPTIITSIDYEALAAAEQDGTTTEAGASQAGTRTPVLQAEDVDKWFTVDDESEEVLSTPTSSTNVRDRLHVLQRRSGIASSRSSSSANEFTSLDHLSSVISNPDNLTLVDLFDPESLTARCVESVQTGRALANWMMFTNGLETPPIRAALPPPVGAEPFPYATNEYALCDQLDHPVGRQYLLASVCTSKMGLNAKMRVYCERGDSSIFRVRRCDNYMRFLMHHNATAEAFHFPEQGNWWAISSVYNQMIRQADLLQQSCMTMEDVSGHVLYREKLDEAPRNKMSVNMPVLAALLLGVVGITAIVLICTVVPISFCIDRWRRYKRSMDAKQKQKFDEALSAAGAVGAGVANDSNSRSTSSFGSPLGSPNSTRRQQQQQQVVAREIEMV